MGSSARCSRRRHPRMHCLLLILASLLDPSAHPHTGPIHRCHDQRLPLTLPLDLPGRRPSVTDSGRACQQLHQCSGSSAQQGASVQPYLPR
jgi:hypothetical protein